MYEEDLDERSPIRSLRLVPKLKVAGSNLLSRSVSAERHAQTAPAA
jgi:hypothetical protein